jgi:hypothetical protein
MGNWEQAQYTGKGITSFLLREVHIMCVMYDAELRALSFAGHMLMTALM